MTFHVSATPLSGLPRSQSTPPRHAGTKQEAAKRYHTRRMLTTTDVPLSARHGSPQTRSSPVGRKTTVPTTTRRRYATRSTVLSTPDVPSSRPKVPSPSMFKPHSKRDVIFTLRRKLSVESVPLNRIPSFMDHFLNYQSPSVDYDSEEILLDIAYRIKLNNLRHILGPECGTERDPWTFKSGEDISDRDHDTITTQTRHPDSFERSTSSWMDV
ncbi:hypothetical protein L218DRAFT_959241 [Marasmius fiardii PR-910]|nr:hypothetical protein L218DRAFT_959241 [Marasmius fiardii PR-910]